MSTTTKRALVAVLVVTFGVAVLVSPFASGSPDGLEKVAADEGFDTVADDHALADGPLADYGVQGIDQEQVATALAGFLGVALILGLTWLLSRAVRGRTSSASRADAEPAPS
jgi:cobalt/nickel transport system permease protein